jgi:hypothetical protein
MSPFKLRDPTYRANEHSGTEKTPKESCAGETPESFCAEETPEYLTAEFCSLNFLQKQNHKFGVQAVDIPCKA